MSGNIFGSYAKAALDRYQQRGTTFFKLDAYDAVKSNTHIRELFEEVRRRLPRRFDVSGELERALESAVDHEVQRHENGWRVFESFPDPQSRGRGRVFMPLDRMKLSQLKGAFKQVREERQQMVSKEERYRILIDLMQASGNVNATAAGFKVAADREIERLRRQRARA
jgi:hypothetical protein